MALIEDQTEPAKTKKGGSLILLGAVFLVLTAGAVGAGWFLGDMLGKEASAAKAAVAAEATEDGEGDYESTLALLPLPAINTSLAAPADVWARLEASLLFETETDELVAEAVHQDFLAFVRTVKPHQIEGASGYRHFKADLLEIARVRSEGKVKDVLIRTLLFE